MAPYPSPEEVQARLQELAQQPGVQLRNYGESVEGRPLCALIFSSPQPRAPKVMLGANIHGIEWIGTFVALMAASTLAGPGPSPLHELRERAEIWVFVSLNPDAYARTHQQEGLGTLQSMRCNARGVDLNRNFIRPTSTPRRSLPGAGSLNPKKATYIGPSPLSEPESRYLFLLLQRESFKAALNLHSFGGALIHARVTERQDYRHYRGLHRAFLTPRTGPRFIRLGSRIFDTFTGELEDCQHHVFGTWASCLELFAWHESWRQRRPQPTLFWRFNPHDPDAHAKRELPRIAAYFLHSLELPPPQQRFAAEQSHDWPLCRAHLDPA